MTLGMFGLNAILSAVGWWRGNFLAWSENYFQPNGISSVSGSVATLIYLPFFPYLSPNVRFIGSVHCALFFAVVVGFFFVYRFLPRIAA